MEMKAILIVAAVVITLGALGYALLRKREESPNYPTREAPNDDA